MLYKFYIILFLAFLSLAVKAQEAVGYFGKNRIQSKKYDWHILSYRNTDIYYVKGNKHLAEFAGTFAEENLITLTETIGFTPYTKLRIVVYGNYQDYCQSNIAINQPELLNNNKGTFVKNRIEIVFKGTQSEFENDLREGISGALINNMLYGGSFKEIIQSAYFLSLPEWFAQGASRYIAIGWDLKMDNFVRSLSINNTLKNPETYSGEEATLIGQSIWNYFVIEYGQIEMQMLLNFLKVAKNHKMAFESTTGTSYNEFIMQWKKFYKNNTQNSEFSEETPSIVVKNKEDLVSLSTISETELLLVTKENSRYKLKAKSSVSDKKSRTLLKGGNRVLNREQDYYFPIVRYSEKAQIGFLTDNNKGFLLKIAQNQPKKEWKKYQISGLRNITDFEFSPDGRSIIISGSNSTNSDIYQYFFQNKKLIQITNLTGDEVNPGFYPSGTKIVFSSNAAIDSVSGQSVYQIFAMDLQNKKIEQLFTMAGNCHRPKVASDKLYFINDYTGIQNIYSYAFQDSGIYKVSSSQYNISQFEISNNNNLTVITQKVGDENISNIIPDTVVSTVSNHQPGTKRSIYLNENKPARTITLQEDQEEIVDEELLKKERQENIDIYNYRFESEKQLNRSEQIRKKLNSGIYSKGPFKYNNPFSVEQINSTFLIDPLRGLGLYLDAGMTDVLENHKITIGIFGLTNLKSSSLFGEYQMLKYRTDFGLRYDRKTLYAVSNSLVERYALNELKVNVSYPFDFSKKITISPFIATTTYNPQDLNFTIADTIKTNTFYYGSKEVFVMDNTIARGLNSRKGFRGFVYLENYVSTQQYKSFGKLGIDLRYYQPLYKKISLATRGFYGSFFGKAPKNFLAGGMNNWLFNKTNQSGSGEPLRLETGVDNSNLLFIEYITPIRGFNYNQQFGTKTFVLNAELRIPFVEIFYPREISSVFLKNFEVIGFTDLGAAWSGDGLFSDDNTLNTVVKNDPNSPFSAVVNNYKKPYLWGYGFGFRSMLLGYFVKLDIAWGVLDGQAQGTKYYFTFGYDF